MVIRNSRRGLTYAVTAFLGTATSTCSSSSPPPATLGEQLPGPTGTASGSSPTPVTTRDEPPGPTGASPPAAVGEQSRVDARVPPRVRRLIAEQLAVDESDVTYYARIVEDLGADSLDQVGLVLGLEEQFGIAVPDEDAEKLRRVQDIVEYLKKRNLKN